MSVTTRRPWSLRLTIPLAAIVLAAGCTKRVDSRPPGDVGAGPTTGKGTEPADETPKLGTDPALLTGTLANGMTYYIRHHEKPEKRVYLWLAVDAGSVLEDEDQRGLAHFVEHMAFNGTKRFEKNTLIDFLEKSGMDFGADLNAFTSFDETVYQLKVPTDDAALVTKGLDILEDWSGALSFDPEEVQKERGVVVEEWRLGRGAGQRIFDKQWPIFLKGSKYAERKPIGEREILEKAPVATLKRFYDDWYRPDLMAIVVVGDVDPKAMLKEIEKRWGARKGPAKAREREKVPVPLLDETRAAVITDPEASSTQVSVAIKGPYRKLSTEGDYRRQLVENLFQGMLRARLDEIRQKGDSPFVFAFSSTSSMGRAVDVFNLTAGVKGGRVEEALKTLVTEVERVKQHGFLATELERERARTQRSLERAVTEKDTVDGRSYAFDTVRRHLEKKAMPGREAELAMGTKFLPGITLEEVNSLAGEWTKRTDRVVIATGPARDKMPGDQDLLAVVKSVDGSKIAAYEDKGAGATLMATKPTPGTITKRETVDGVGVTVWTLSNGAKVVIKPTDFKKDEVLLEAFSPGGTSLLDNKKWKAARFAGEIMQRSGAGEHDAVTLRNMMAGKVVSVNAWIGELEEGMRGNASPKDLETMLQLVHLAITQPRKDADAFASWKTSTAEFVKNRDLNPQQVFFEKLQAFSWNNHLRRQPLTAEDLEAANHDASLDFYKDRFADVGDFTFVFVGNVDEKTLEPLVTTYLASLPSKGRKEKWKDVGAKMPGGVKKLKVEKGQDPKAFVMLNYHGATKWSADAEDDVEILADVMEIRLREVLREDMSGVYGAFSRGNIARRPKQLYQYTIGFGCGPENAEKLQKAVFDIASALKKDGISQDYLDKVKEKRRRELETQVKENRFWMGQLSEHYRYGTDPKQILELDKTLARITSDNVKKTAGKFLKDGVRIEGLLLPEGGAPAAAPAVDPNKPAAKPTAPAKPEAAAKGG